MPVCVCSYLHSLIESIAHNRRKFNEDNTLEVICCYSPVCVLPAEARWRYYCRQLGKTVMNRMPHLKDDALLLLTAAIWGFAFVAQRLGMRLIGPFTFNGIRFGLGSLALLPLIWLKPGTGRHGASGKRANGRGESPSAKKSIHFFGLIAGVVLFLAASLQQVGIIYTSAGKAGFITGLYVILVPLSGLIWGQKPGWGRWVGTVLAVGGLYLLSVTKGFSISRGDSLVLLSAFLWAAHGQLIGRFSPRTDPLQLASLQFAVCSLLSLITAGFLETIRLQAILQTAVPIVYGGLFSVGVAYTLQVVVQKTAHPTHAAVILSLEGVFAVLGGWLILGELLSLRGVLGCILMLMGIVFSQTSRRGNPANRKDRTGR